MIEYLITSSVILVVFLSFYYLILEAEKIHLFNRFYLLLSLLISLIIPIVKFEIIKIIPVVQNIETIKIDSYSPVIGTIPTEVKVIALQETINYFPYLIWSLYFVVSSLLFVRFVRNCFKLNYKSATNPIVKYKNANLVLVKEKILPHTFLNSIFVNIDDYTNRNIEQELYTHELVHVTQKHTLDILFIEILKVLFWFNPLFILYKNAIQLNHEFLADEEIVKTYNNVPFYQNLLLQKSSDQPTIYLASNLNYSVTKKRLIMMTKKTTSQIAVLKKTCTIPLLVGLIYFFCIKIVAQEKIITINSEKKKIELTAQDKTRDAYYSNVRIILQDLITNTSINKMYEELSLEQKRNYLNRVPEKRTENEIPKPLFDKMKVEDMAVWIDGKVVSKDEIKKYNRKDFSYYTFSFVHKNARSKKFPQKFQYNLYTKVYFDKNLKTSHLHFSNDTLKMVVSNSKKNNIKASTDTSKLKTEREKSPFLTYGNRKLIVIDAGHGGIDNGAEIQNEAESKIVESLAKKISLLNRKGEVEIILIRDEDHFISLNDRVKRINEINPTLLISLHINASENTDENGINAYVSTQNSYYEESVENAENLIKQIANNNLEKGEVKNANLFIIKNSKCPAVLLQVGYLSNEKDRKYIASENGKNEIANKIFEFIKQ